MSLIGLRKNLLTRPIFKWAKGALPHLSDTERDALDAGDVWWDAELFSGNPDWSILLKTPAAKLSAEELKYIDGPVSELCRLLNDWKINWELKDLPPEVWAFIKKNKFLAIIIPKKYGGLEFSAYAHSEIVRKIASRSVVAAVTVMVPNSLGPGELLMHFGTDEQQCYWLPRLAEGIEIPCFGLTSPEAGSDAAAMVDSGTVCKGLYDGKEVLGIRLNWRKRYTTLGPIIIDRSGKAILIVVSDGGFLGIGKKVAAFDYDKVITQQPDGKVVMSLSQNMVFHAADFSYEQEDWAKAKVIPSGSISIDALLKGDVLDNNGKKVANIDNVYIRNADVSQIIVSFNKKLGMGGSLAALNYDDLQMVKKKKTLDFKLTSDQTAQFKDFKESVAN